MMRRRLPGRSIAAGLVAVIAFVGLVALGTWQVHRLAWKRALIERVDARIHAAPVAAPASATKNDAYLRVRASGEYLFGRDTLVQAVTDRGSGYWVVTPLRTRGFTVLVNRGFVTAGQRNTGLSAPATVTGLLRVPEPGGAFLRSNDPAGNRWYSRDVVAIARARGLGPVAPYFIDADAASSVAGGPVGGLTVIAFANNHLVYAITWYTLAAMIPVLCGLAWRKRADADTLPR